MAGDGYLPRGVSTVVPGGDGAALWAAPGDGLDGEFWSANGSRFVTLLEGDVERLGLLSEQMDAHHPHDRDHWYLMAIGVSPAAQGRRLGSALLAHTLADADAAGAPAYLEATSPRSRALYAAVRVRGARRDARPGRPAAVGDVAPARRRRFRLTRPHHHLPPSRAPWAMAPSVMANPTSCTGDSASPLAIQPSAAPVTGAASPSSGGADAGRRRIPANHTTNARPVATTLR